MISVIIPTFKSPDSLDLALRSLVEGQYYKETNQILVVVDGHYDINKDVLEKYSKHIDVLNLEENVGLPRATNLGVYNASQKYILIINDDNVAPYLWDTALLNSYKPNYVLTPNQVEPYPSMFKQFNIHDMGRDPKTFDLEKFWKYDQSISDRIEEETGSTLPIFMTKIDYMRVGGWDESYPGPWTCDWDFFLKCELSGMKMMRTYNCHFYHFVSLSTKTPEQIESSRLKEHECHNYFRYKWGQYAVHNPETNSKMLSF